MQSYTCRPRQAFAAVVVLAGALVLTACSSEGQGPLAPAQARRSSPPSVATEAAAATFTAAATAAPIVVVPPPASVPGTSTGAEQGGYTLAPGGHCGAVGTKRIEGAARANGGMQELTIGTKAGYFDPNEITAEADVPLRVVFDGRSQCIQGIAFPELGIERRLIDGRVTVTLPGLRTGSYTLSCTHNMAFAKIYVKAG